MIKSITRTFRRVEYDSNKSTKPRTAHSTTGVDTAPKDNNGKLARKEFFKKLAMLKSPPRQWSTAIVEGTSLDIVHFRPDQLSWKQIFSLTAF